MEKDSTEDKEDFKRTGILPQLVAGVFALGGSALAIWAYMRKTVYEFLKKTGALDGALKERAEARAALNADIPNFSKAYLEIDKAYGKAVNDVIKKVNIPFTDKLRMLSKNEVARLAFYGVAATSVVMGAVANIHRTRVLEEQLKILNRKSETEAVSDTPPGKYLPEVRMKTLSQEKPAEVAMGH